MLPDSNKVMMMMIVVHSVMLASYLMYTPGFMGGVCRNVRGLMASAVARAFNGGMGAEPLQGPGAGAQPLVVGQGAKPPKLKAF